jgi:hypothetical protein
MARIVVTYEDDLGNVTTRTATGIGVPDGRGNPSYQAAEVLHSLLPVVGEVVAVLTGDPFRDCNSVRRSNDFRWDLSALPVHHQD